MPTNKLYIIALVFFVLGGLVGFNYTKGYFEAKLKANKQITLAIIDNSTAALKANDELVNTCHAAYHTVTDCASDLDSCDMGNTNNKLEALKIKKEDIYKTINGLTKNMDEIISSYEKAN